MGQPEVQPGPSARPWVGGGGTQRRVWVLFAGLFLGWGWRFPSAREKCSSRTSDFFLLGKNKRGGHGWRKQSRGDNRWESQTPPPACGGSAGCGSGRGVGGDMHAIRVTAEAPATPLGARGTGRLTPTSSASRTRPRDPAQTQRVLQPGQRWGWAQCPCLCLWDTFPSPTAGFLFLPKCWICARP